MLLWTLSCIFGGLAEAQPLTLQQALETALSANLELQQDRLELERAQLYLQQVRGGFDPTLSVGRDRSASSSPSNDADDASTVVTSAAGGWSTGLSQPLPTGGTAGLSWSESWSESDSANQISEVYTSNSAWLSVSQPLLDGAWGSARYGVRSAHLSLNSQALSWRASLEQLALDVNSAYWGLIAAREQLRLVEASVQLAETELADTEERQAEGFAGSGDVLQVRRALGVARQAEVVAEDAAQSAAQDLARLLGLPLERASDLDPTDRPAVPDLDHDADLSMALALRENTTWLQAELQADAARLAFRDSRVESLPSLNISGAVGLSGGAESIAEARQQILDQTNPAWSVGADLSVALPARSDRARYQRAQMTLAQAELALRAAEQDLALSVQAARRAVERDQARAELAEQTLEAARLALEADQDLYREGKASTRDVILSLEAMNEAQVAMLEAQIDLQSSHREFQRVEGGLLRELGLEPSGPATSP